MTPLVYEAMQFARQVHKDQKRKYTNEPYSNHLAEVAGIVAAVTDNPEALATAWLHDTVEDQHAAAPWIQTIKVADIISNSSTITLHDPGYAPNYLDEKRAMLAALDHADSRLMDIAVTQTQRA